MSRKTKPAGRSNTTRSAGSRPSSLSTTSWHSGPSGKPIAKAHDWTPAFKWAFRIVFCVAIVLIVNRALEEMHYADIGRDACTAFVYSGPQCNPETGQCITREAIVLASMEQGMWRQRHCRLDEPVYVQDHAARIWRSLWTPAQESIDTMETITQTAENGYPEPPSLKSGIGGPEVANRPE